MSNNTTYCVYLISYFGSKLPPFYIGSTSIEKISNGYMGSVSSKKYKKIWFDELMVNRHLFKVSIISTHKTREDAVNKEESFHRKLRVVNNPLYVNMTIANLGWGGLSGKDNPMYGVSLECNRIRMKESNPMWNPDVAKKVSDAKSGKPAKNKGKKNIKASERMLENNPMKNTESVAKMLANRTPEDSGKGMIWVANIHTKKRKRVFEPEFNNMVVFGWIKLSNQKPIPSFYEQAIQPLDASTPASERT